MWRVGFTIFLDTLQKKNIQLGLVYNTHGQCETGDHSLLALPD